MGGDDAPRARASGRQIPALINAPWTARSHVVMHLPNGGREVALTEADPGALDLPAVNWQRTIARSGGDVIDTISSRETGAEIPADKLGATAKAIETANTLTQTIIQTN